MKQRAGGQKIQNWHRPLLRSQRVQDFRQRRDEDPAVKRQGRSYYVEETACDPWNPYDPPEAWFSACEYEYDRDAKDFEAFVQDILNPPTPLDFGELTGHAGTKQKADALLAHRETNPPLEERLAEHLERCRRLPQGSDALRDTFQAIIGAREAAVIKRAGGKIFAERSQFARNVCLYAPFWVRSPLTWNKQSQLTLPEHLFAVYEVPSFLHSQWRRWEVMTKWLSWFILIGQGVSLKRAAKFFDWKIPAGLIPHLWDAPPNVSPLEACLFAEVKRVGGSLRDFRRINRNYALAIDPTRPTSCSFDDFRRATIGWITVHGDGLTDDEGDAIIDWAMHQFTETENTGTPFSWKARRIRPTLERESGIPPSAR